MKILGDIMFPLRKYNDRTSGEEKTAWGKCGTLMQNADGAYRIKLDMLPVNPGDGWLAVFENKPQQNKPKQEEADW